MFNKYFRLIAPSILESDVYKLVEALKRYYLYYDEWHSLTLSLYTCSHPEYHGMYRIKYFNEVHESPPQYHSFAKLVPHARIGTLSADFPNPGKIK